jgi:hypothetical protein
MGQLVFQATLGGAVNLIGPNIAGTVNFTLPSADGTSGQALSTNGTGTLAFSSFATLVSNTFSGSQTLSGGTANGVTYLNGSKVLTSGSALQFDGTSLFVGATSGLGKLVVKDTASSNTLWLVGRTSDGASSVSFRNAADSAYNARLEAVSGQLAFEANGSEQMRLTSTGLGIGTSSPSERLDVQAPLGRIKLTSTTGTNSVLIQPNNTGGSLNIGIDSSTGGSLFGVSAYAAGIVHTGAYPLYLGTNNAIRATIDSSGNLGVGTTSPTNKIDLGFTDTTIGWYNNSTYSSGITYGTSARSLTIFTKSGDDSDFIAFKTGISSAERVRIDRQGEVVIGSSSTGASSRLAIVGGATLCMMKNTDATDGTARNTILFRDNGDNNRGTITVSTSGTVYNTTSDYRLKEDIAPMTGALAKVAQLNPVTYKWKETGDSGQGFIAHELAQVVPECVTGEKDAVEQRNGQEFIVPQGIDTSFLVATLTAAIQEQQALIQSLKARLDAANL